MNATPNRSFDPVTLEILWSRLISIADESAAALLRTAFSTVVRESNDFTTLLLDDECNCLAENTGGIPTFVDMVPSTVKAMLERIPVERWRPGDCVIANDPWLGSGHLPDVTTASPIFHRGRLVGFSGSIAHLPDIGGSWWACDTRELFEEGLGLWWTMPSRTCVAPFGNDTRMGSGRDSILVHISDRIYSRRMNLIRELRREAGVTQRELAQRGGTSQSAIAAYETDAKSPTIKTVQRLASSLGLELFVAFMPRMTREDRRSLAFHRAIARLLQDNPAPAMERARRNLAKLRALHPHAQPLLGQWESWLALPAEELVPRLLGVEMTAREMRQVSPFAGLLSPRERARILRAFRSEEDR